MTQSVLDKAGGSRKKLWELLQVMENKKFGYRKAVQAYKVTKQVPAAKSQALANPKFGPRGGGQYFVSPANEQYLTPMGGATPLGD